MNLLGTLIQQLGGAVPLPEISASSRFAQYRRRLADEHGIEYVRHLAAERSRRSLERRRRQAAPVDILKVATASTPAPTYYTEIMRRLTGSPRLCAGVIRSYVRRHQEAEQKHVRRALRLARMLQFLHDGERTVTVIMDHFGVTWRTARQDLALLTEWGMAICRPIPDAQGHYWAAVR